jgi:rhamnose transport system substrate-binding protein
MNFGKKLRAVAVVAAVSLAFAAAGCGGGGESGGEATPEASAPAEEANLAITFLPKNLGNPYFDNSDKGGETAIKEFGGKYAEVGPAEATPDAQVSYINTLTQQQVGAIVISANDKQAVCDALTEARDNGVKVVTFDSDTNPDCRNLFVNQATAEGIAKVQIDMIAEQIGDAGEIAILSASANATNQNAWIELMKWSWATRSSSIRRTSTSLTSEFSYRLWCPALLRLGTKARSNPLRHVNKSDDHDD